MIDISFLNDDVPFVQKPFFIACASLFILAIVSFLILGLISKKRRVHRAFYVTAAVALNVGLLGGLIFMITDLDLKDDRLNSKYEAAVLEHPDIVAFDEYDYKNLTSGLTLDYAKVRLHNNALFDVMIARVDENTAEIFVEDSETSSDQWVPLNETISAADNNE